MCMTRLNQLDLSQPVTIEPMRAFPLIRDLVTDVSWNFQAKKRIRKFTPRPTDSPDGTWRMAQVDVERVREFRKCIECFLCQDVCHVLRDHRLFDAFVGPRHLVYAAALEMNPLDVDDRTRSLKEEHGIGYCNITKCCTRLSRASRSPTMPSSAQGTGDRSAMRSHREGVPGTARRSPCLSSRSSRRRPCRALAKAERYRLLNEPGGQRASASTHSNRPDESGSDRCSWAITDQFDADPTRVGDVENGRPPHDRVRAAYYSGIIHERRAKGSSKTPSRAAASPTSGSASVACYERRKRSGRPTTTMRSSGGTPAPVSS
jgi:hypothetical protein